MSMHRWHTKVRQYEIDYQGIVNHAIYLNFFQEARDDYIIKVLNMDVQKFLESGYIFVVAAMELKYLASLRSQEEFYVTVKLTSYDHKRIHFEQEIRRQANDKLVTTATVHVACVELASGRAVMPDHVKIILDRALVF